MSVHEGPARLLGIAGGGHAQALAFQEFRQKVTNFAVVVDHQNMRQGVHGCYNSEAAPRWAAYVAIGDNW
jgi:hypothetical protein